MRCRPRHVSTSCSVGSAPHHVERSGGRKWDSLLHERKSRIHCDVTGRVRCYPSVPSSPRQLVQNPGRADDKHYDGQYNECIRPFQRNAHGANHKYSSISKPAGIRPAAPPATRFAVTHLDPGSMRGDSPLIGGPSSGLVRRGAPIRWNAAATSPSAIPKATMSLQPKRVISQPLTIVPTFRGLRPRSGVHGAGLDRRRFAGATHKRRRPRRRSCGRAGRR